MTRIYLDLEDGVVIEVSNFQELCFNIMRHSIKTIAFGLFDAVTGKLLSEKQFSVADVMPSTFWDVK